MHHLMAFLPWVQSSSAAGCPEGLYSLYPLGFTMQRQDKALSNLVRPQRCPCCEQEVGLDASQGSFQLELSYDTKSFLK